MTIEHYPATVTFDPEVGAWYVNLRSPLDQRNVSRTESTTRTVNFDFGITDNLLGIEIL